MAAQRFEEPYNGVVLKCTPTQLRDGRWAPTLYVTAHLGHETTETAIAILDAPESFATPQEAADFARSVGRKWADDHA